MKDNPSSKRRLQSQCSRRLSGETLLARLRAKDLTPTQRDFADQSQGLQSKLPVRCGKGHHNEVTLAKLARLPGCPTCRAQSRRQAERQRQVARIDAVLESAGGKRLSPAEQYINQSTQIRFHCGHCGEDHTKRAQEIIVHKYCRAYGLEKSRRARRLTYEKVQRAVQAHQFELGWTAAQFADEYLNRRTLLPLKCREGHEFEVRWDDFRRVPNCRICSGFLFEKFTHRLAEQAFGLTFQTHARPSFLNRLELDLFAKEQALAIEIDGPTHDDARLHSSHERFTAQQQRDAKKDALCKQHGVTLIRINLRELNIGNLRDDETFTRTICTRIYQQFQRKAATLLLKPCEELLPIAYQQIYLPSLQGSYSVKTAKQLCRDKGYAFIDAAYEGGILLVSSRCPEGHVNRQQLGNLRHHNCRQCGVDARACRRRNPLDDVRKRFEHEGWLIDPQEVLRYKTNLTRLRVRCQHCGGDSVMSLVKAARGCSSCRKTKAMDARRQKMVARIDEKLAKFNATRVSPAMDYQNQQTRIHYRCSLCGEVHQVSAQKILQNQRCPHDRYRRGAKTRKKNRSDVSEANRTPCDEDAE